MSTASRPGGSTSNRLLDMGLCLPAVVIIVGFLAITLLLFLTSGTTQQIVFILYGAPVIYGALRRNFQHSVLIAASAGVLVTLGRFNVLLDNWFARQWIQLFFEGLFVPLFYLVFCLFISWVLLEERRLQQEYREISDQLRLAFDNNLKLFTSTITALAATIDAKDSYTSGHSERVQQIVRQMLEKMNLSEEAKREIIYAAILHDIGKIGVGGDILGKTTSLTAEEFEKIKQHPAIGANILQSITQLQDVIPLIYYHHERYDGNGYPEGLKGEEIPLGARIIAVADTYDAITSNRPYRIVRTEKWAREEMCRCSGTQFDPKVLRVFLQCLDQVEELKGETSIG